MPENDDKVQRYGYRCDELEAGRERSEGVLKLAKRMLAVMALACIGAAGYELWNYDPPKQWDITEQAAEWWQDFSNRERKFPRKRAWDPDDLPEVDVPLEPIEAYDLSF